MLIITYGHPYPESSPQNRDNKSPEESFSGREKYMYKQEWYQKQKYSK